MASLLYYLTFGPTRSRRRFRKRVSALIDPIFEAMSDPALRRLPQQFPSVDRYLDELSDGEVTSPEQASSHLLCRMVTSFVTDDIDASRRNDVLDKIQVYVDAASRTPGAAAPPTDDLALLVLVVEDKVEGWAESGAVTKEESAIIRSELLGALSGISAEQRKAHRLIDLIRGETE